MNRPTPTQNAVPDEPHGAQSGDSAPALTAASGSSPRGEVFEAEALVLEPQSEVSSSSAWHPSWLAAGAALLFCTYTFGAYVGQKSKVPAPIGPFSTQKADAAPVVVHIVGRVKKPGVYTLKSGARLQDAIQKAGGALPGADLGALNLADWAADGSKIEIPSRQSAKPNATATPTIIIKEVFVTPPQNTPELAENSAPQAVRVASRPAKTNPLAATGNTQSDDGIPRAATKSGGKSSNASLEFLRKNPLDLNRATAEQLEVLPGVGPAMSARIIAYRAENGGFKTIDDLDSVRGIGEKRMETLRPLVKVK